MRKIKFLPLFVSFHLFFVQLIAAQDANELKSQIYSKLKCCPCVVSFDKCTCPEAKEMKAYIDALIDAGVTENEIFYKVAKRFSLNTITDKEIKSEIEERLVEEIGENLPRITLEPASFNFGKVSKKQGKIQMIFKLYNKGSEKLIITNLKTSCVCVTVSLRTGKNRSPYFGTQGSGSGWGAVVAPGEVAELDILLDLSHASVKLGDLIREIYITSNDPIYPEFSVRIEAQVDT